jgi:hypothetical protein
MRTSFWMVVLAAALLPAAAAASSGPPAALVPGSALALPIVGVSTTSGPTAGLGASLDLSTPLVAPIRYHPRGRYRDRGYMMPTTTQVHAGFFSPTHNFDTGFDGGFRIGPQIDPNVQIGVAMDWYHSAQSNRESLGSVTMPIGAASEELVLSRSSAELLPFLGFVQVSGDENMSVIPYGGAGIGYEWLFVHGDDFVHKLSFDQTFGGFAWQVWGGVGIPLSGRTRLNGEVFYNGSEVGSDVDVFDPNLGPITVRDLVKMDGVGMRFGVSWGF